MNSPLCLLSTIEQDSAKGFPYRGGRVFVVRQKGKVYVYENRCPHFGINLDCQPDRFFSFDNQYLQCSMHGALFDIETGDCISGPCRGQPLTRINFQLVDGHIYLDEDYVPTPFEL